VNQYVKVGRQYTVDRFILNKIRKFYSEVLSYLFGISFTYPFRHTLLNPMDKKDWSYKILISDEIGYPSD
jgi:hypothetical protein